MIRTYSELLNYKTLVDRFEYLKLRGRVGDTTFGFDRWMNQKFYRSTEWKQLRDFVIVRDNGCDLGVPEHEIHELLIIHHLNPMTVDDIVHSNEANLDPEFLISTTHKTHNAIHYGDASLLPRPHINRAAGDTKLW